MQTKNNSAIDQLIIDVSLIDPLEKIIIQLQNGEFRDCDIRWLDDKLEKFTRFACQTIGLGIPQQPPKDVSNVLNPLTVNKYISHFSTLLAYFKSI